jgi:16S rRNA G527 N7-methylase RsmG
VRQLGIGNATPLLGRADMLEPRPHAAVIAQAMAQPERAVRWMLPWVGPGGLMLIPSGKNPPQLTEIKGVIQLRPVAYQVPCGGPERSVWMGRRSVE